MILFIAIYIILRYTINCNREFKFPKYFLTKENFMNNSTQFQTIRQVAKLFNLPEYSIRRLVKTGRAPGFFSGNRFYLNVPEFENQLNSCGGCIENVKNST